ncbi:hypothetical protein PG994_010013 [Apiospora phragmitis]|uniref:Wax synthase domain-containing protein n=1 Tax=Apiospora phragmitis TaxID=2905665 RepID=A0ABR1TNQ0_9PEZI
MLRTGANLRRLQLTDGNTAAPSTASLWRFAILRCCRMAVMYTVYSICTALHTILQDFSRSGRNLGLLSDPWALGLRAYMSVEFFIYSHAVLTGLHDLAALIGVSLLGWDQPQDWPPLFGDITEAYTLRRFWGVYWHRLHVASLSSFMPAALRSGPAAGLKNDKRRLKSAALRTLVIFTLSALVHAAVGWFIMRDSSSFVGGDVCFLLLNGAVCVLERVVERRLGRAVPGGVRGWWFRPLGYVWVLLVFLCVAPACLYPWIYSY